MVNKVILIGNLGKDPVITESNGNKIANFSFATSETYNNKQGEKQTDTEWHNVTAFGKQAEILEKYVKKGSKLFIEGKIQTKDYTPEDGIKRWATKVILRSFQMLDPKGLENTNNNHITGAPVDANVSEGVEDGYTPF